MQLGVCYYPEHWDESRWAIDAALFRDAGLTLVRMAEFAWSKLEPRPGVFEFDWLDRAVDTFAREHFRIVLGTPTAAPPAWLSRTHPDTLPVNERGQRKNFGGRRHYCPNSAVYHAYTIRIVEQLAQRYGSDARIIGWQIDNEFGEGNSARCYCENCIAAFQVWLGKKYGTPDALNHAWGNAFWSQEYSDWSQIGAPMLVGSDTPNPSHALDYFRFSSDSFVDYQQLQISTLRNHIQPTQFLTHNFMGLFPDLDQYELAKPLSFVSWDSYPTGMAEYKTAIVEHADDGTFPPDVGNPYLTSLAHAVVRGSKDGAPFWIMEQQGGNVNWGIYNPSPRPGVTHLWWWHNFLMGADATLIFRERATLFAQEQYHSGLLNHDGSPAQGYADLLSFEPHRKFLETIRDTRVQNEVAILISYEDLYALCLQPHRAGMNYWNILFTWYAALQRAGVPCDVISKHADLSGYKLVIAPTLHLADQPLADHLHSYVNSGGLVVLGIRSGFKTPTNTVTAEPLPGALRALVGAKITAWHSLPPNVTHPVALIWRGWQKIDAARWVETLEPETESAGTIAAYLGTHLDGQTAMTANQIGAGRVMYVGWLPDRVQADALVGMLIPEAGIEPIGILPYGVVAGTRERQGECFLLLANFTDEEKRVWLNRRAWCEIETGETTASEITLSPRSVRALRRATLTPLSLPSPKGRGVGGEGDGGQG